jgi:hypothetical protein
MWNDNCRQEHEQLCCPFTAFSQAGTRELREQRKETIGESQAVKRDISGEV